MLIFIFLVNILYINLSNGEIFTNCTCGKSNSAFSSRIIGGRETKPHEYPWMAALRMRNGAVFCGGALVSNRHVLTAGHCAYHDPENFPLSPAKYISLGKHNLDNNEDGELDVEIEKIYLHPNWEVFENYDNADMAIYQLSKPVEFTDTILPICLPNDVKDYTGAKALVAGWGLTVEKGMTSSYLQDAKLTVYGDEECEQSEQIRDMFDSRSMQCALAPGKDACQGDSGGPLFLETSLNRFEQIGVTSFGVGCGQDIPAIYTKVSTSLAWIRSIVDQADICMDPELEEN